MQEALLRAWSRRHTLRDEQLFSTWLMRIVINECKTLVKKRKRTLPYAQVPETDRQLPPDADREWAEALLLHPEAVSRFRIPNGSFRLVAATPGLKSPVYFLPGFSPGIKNPIDQTVVQPV